MRQLNTVLESRVAERTQALQNVNDRLAAEIGERRRVNEALLASERLLADTIDHSSATVSLKDLGGRYLLVNREFERLFGRQRLELIGRRDEHMFAPSVAGLLRERDADVLSSRAPISFEQEMPTDGGLRSYVCVKFPLRGATGLPYGVGSMSTDITVVNSSGDAASPPDEGRRLRRTRRRDDRGRRARLNQPLRDHHYGRAGSAAGAGEIQAGRCSTSRNGSREACAPAVLRGFSSDPAENDEERPSTCRAGGECGRVLNRRRGCTAHRSIGGGHALLRCAASDQIERCGQPDGTGAGDSDRRPRATRGRGRRDAQRRSVEVGQRSGGGLPPTWRIALSPFVTRGAGWAAGWQHRTSSRPRRSPRAAAT